MYSPVLELFKNFYRMYFKFMARMTLWRSFNYNRLMTHADTYGYIGNKRAEEGSIKYHWKEISNQKVSNKEILLDKIDFVLAFCKLLLIFILLISWTWYRLTTLK